MFVGIQKPSEFKRRITENEALFKKWIRSELGAATDNLNQHLLFTGLNSCSFLGLALIHSILDAQARSSLGLIVLTPMETDLQDHLLALPAGIGIIRVISGGVSTKDYLQNPACRNARVEMGVDFHTAKTGLWPPTMDTTVESRNFYFPGNSQYPKFCNTIINFGQTALESIGTIGLQGDKEGFNRLLEVSTNAILQQQNLIIATEACSV